MSDRPPSIDRHRRGLPVLGEPGFAAADEAPPSSEGNGPTSLDFRRPFPSQVPPASDSEGRISWFHERPLFTTRELLVRSVRRSFDAGCFAALALTVFDAAVALFRHELSALGVLCSLATLVTAAAIAGPIFAVVAVFLARFDEKMAAHRWIWVALGSAAPAAPLALIAARLGAESAGAGRVAGVASLGVFALAVVAGMRWSAPLTWLVAAPVATLVTLVADRSLAMMDRVGRGALDPALWLAIGSGVVTVALGAALARFLRACAGRPLARRLGLASIAAAAVVALVGVVVVPRANGQAQSSGVFAAGALFALGGMQFAFRRAPFTRVALGAAATAGTLAVFAFFAPFSRAWWLLTERTHVASLVLRASGLKEAVDARAFRSFQPLVHCPAPGAPTVPPRASGTGDERLSVLLVTIDTVRYDHVGYSGRAPDDLTPAIDRFAATATRFHRAYAYAPWTSLSLSALVWGRPITEWEFEKYFEDGEGHLLPASSVMPASGLRRMVYAPGRVGDPSLAELLAASGRATALIARDEGARVFDPAMGLVRGFGRVAYVDAPGNPRLDDAGEAARAVEMLRDLASGPFFFHAHFYAPHGPYVAGAAGGRFQGYAGEVHASDSAVGALLTAVDQLGLADRTLVVVTADHGEELHEHGGSGHATAVYDEVLRVPLLVRMPGVAPRDVRVPVSLIDVAPTILDAIGLAAPSSYEGRGLGPLMLGRPEPLRHVMLETWQEMPHEREPSLHLVGVVRGDRKAILDVFAHAGASYDLANDPGELRPDFDLDLGREGASEVEVLARAYRARTLRVCASTNR